MANEDLMVRMRADIRALQAGLRAAARETQIATASMENSFKRSRVSEMIDDLGRRTQGLARLMPGLTTAATVAGAATLAAGKQALEAAGDLQALSDKTGVGVEALQELRFQASQTGAQFEGVTAGLAKYTRQLGLAQTGNAAAAQDFSRLGVAISGPDGLRSAEAVLADVLAALERIPDAARRGAAAQELFGKSGLELAVMVAEGEGATRRYAEQARAFGLVLETDLVRGGDAAGDALETLQQIAGAGLSRALLQSAPLIQEWIEELTADPVALQQRIQDFVDAGTAIVQVGAAAAGWLGDVIAFGKGLKTSFEAFRDSFKDKRLPFAGEIEQARERLTDLRQELVRQHRLGLDTSQASAAIDAARQDLQRFVALQREALDAGLPKPAAPAAAVGGAAPPAGAGGDPLADEIAERQAELARQLADQRREQQAALVQQIREGVASELSLEEMKYQEKRRQLLAADETAFRSAGERHQLLEALESEHQARVAAIQQQEEDRISLATANRLEADAQRQALLGDLEAEILGHEQRLVAAELEAHAAKLARLAEFSEQELELVGGYLAAREALEMEHAKRLADIHLQGLEQRFSFTQFARNKEQAYLATVADAALGKLSTQSKKAFEVQKALSLANAVVTLPSAVIKSYEAAGGFPLGVAAAAAMTAAGLAQISAIKNAKFGGAQGAALPGAAASGGGSFGPNGQPPAGNAPGGPRISLTLNGSNFSQDQVRQLIEQIQEALGNGATLDPRGG